MRRNQSTVLATRGIRLAQLHGTATCLPQIVFKDSLAMGPSSLDPSEHVIVRTNYWQSITQSAIRLKSASKLEPECEVDLRQLDRGRKLVFLLDKDPNDALQLFQLCSKLNPRQSKVHFAVCDANEHLDLSQVDEISEIAIALSGDDFEQLSTCWQVFCKGELQKLDELSQGLHPVLGQGLSLMFDAMLPSSRRHMLSKFDLALLMSLPYGSKRYNSEIVGDICSLFPWIPELCSFARLSDWEDTAVQYLSGQAWNRRLYELTESGRDILLEKIGLRDQPVLQLGGADVYAVKDLTIKK